MALVRMVNGLVDPLQLGVYARPISSIATQIGLPMWLVELRHSATHEELPSLEVLRTAAREVSPSDTDADAHPDTGSDVDAITSRTRRVARAGAATPTPSDFRASV